MNDRTTLRSLEKKRAVLCRKIAELGDLRPGSVTVHFRRCGKKNCACARPGHRGHGPQYLWTSTYGGARRSKSFRPGPELDKVRKEVENYRNFQHLCRELVLTNLAICDLRPVGPLGPAAKAPKQPASIRSAGL